MKKFTLFSLVMLSAALAFTSCSKELDPGQVRTKEVAVSLATRLPSAPQSRAVTEQVADILLMKVFSFYPYAEIW